MSAVAEPLTTASPSSAGVAAGDRQRDRAPGEPTGPGGRSNALSLLRGLVRLARPRQWTKNLLVFAAPAAAGVLDNRGPAIDALIAFVAFCMAASGTYYINDARDADADRLHPTKRTRPVASGVVPVAIAYAGGAALLAASVALAFVATPELAATVVGYVVLTTAYSLGLKNVAVVDLVAVAAGFVLRAVAGAAATDVPISDWFFIVTSFGALFIVSGKRGAEASEMAGSSDADARQFRAVLGAYSESYMAYLRSVTSGAVLDDDSRPRHPREGEQRPEHVVNPLVPALDPAVRDGDPEVRAGAGQGRPGVGARGHHSG